MSQEPPIRPKRGFLFSLGLIMFSLGQVIGLIFSYLNALYLSQIIREVGTSLFNTITGEQVTVTDLTIYLLIQTLFCLASLIGLYGVWQWKRWGVSTILVLGLLYLTMEILSGTSFYDLRLGLGLMDYTNSSWINLGPLRVESPVPTIVAVGVAIGMAIYRRRQWFD